MSHLTEHIPSKATKILDLNDHVLQGVFENMNDIDLSVVADVWFDFRMQCTGRVLVSLSGEMLRLFVTFSTPRSRHWNSAILVESNITSSSSNDNSLKFYSD